MMAFPSSFFTPDLAPPPPGAAATNQPQQDQEPPAIKKESSTAPDGEQNPNSVQETQPSSSMPHSERGRSARSSSAMDHEMADGASLTTRTAASKKKKGTAAAVKTPSKRARPGGPKKAKGGPKRVKTAASTKHSGGGADTADGDGGNSSESDHGPYCLCRGPDDHRFMIACDRCEDWFHGECIGMDKHTGEHLVQKYICPNCTDGGRYATRYKKMCSLSGCADPARIYDAVRPSIFCSPEHCQAWWEQLIATLPRTKGAAAADYLTQEEFMGLLDAPRTSSSPANGQQADLPTTPWHLGKPPFSTPPNFWDSPASSHALTPEEQALLTTSATARYHLGEEIVLCKKMLQLIDLALKQREAAIAAGRGTAKDLCGYDFRLDTVGATHQFALFLQTPQAEAIFKSGRLDSMPLDTTTITTTNPSSSSSPPPPPPPPQPQPPTSATTTAPAPSAAPPPTSAGTGDPDYPRMCPKKKCKPHNGWSAILTKTVRHDMKELAAQAKEMLDAEQRVRDGAAGRWGRRRKEGNCVVVLGGGGVRGGEEEGGGGGDLGEGEGKGVGMDICY